MSSLTLPQALALALQHHQAGRLAQAEGLYRQILAVDPRHADALHYVGVIAHQAGRHDLAIEWIGQSLALNPRNAQAYSNLGGALLNAGRRTEAIAAYERSLEIDPNEASAHYNLGNALRDSGRLDEAIAAFRSALDLRPDQPMTLNNLGGVLRLHGKLDAATAAYRQATQIKPDYAEAWNNLGIALRDQGHLDEAVAAYRRAQALMPHSAQILSNLGIALVDLDRYAEALSAYERAIQLEPTLADAHYNLGSLFNFLGRLDEAIAANRRTLELRPKDADAYYQLSGAFKTQGALREAISALRTGTEYAPDNPELQSSLIYALHFQTEEATRLLAEEQARWNRRFSNPVREKSAVHTNGREPGRRLRIGYVSPDLRDHVIGRNLVPLFRHHDSAQFEILCYSASRRTDHVTEFFRQHVGVWRSIIGLSHEALAATIVSDEVDILVDLTQHMGGNRLPAFARQPAPVQVSFAGYPESTGLETIAYRLSDRWLEGQGGEMAGGQWAVPKDAAPASVPGESSGLTSPGERVFLLDSFWCYDPQGLELPVNALPALKNGRVTFGCLNNFCKVNEALLRLWARVLGAVQDSRLILLSHGGSHRQRTLAFLGQEGVTASRVEFVSPAQRQPYMELYHRLDMVLDTFPYNGHTTSLDALWMGVPVVSLCGDRSVSRAGLSQLGNLGLNELVAFTEDQYLAIATQLARDLPRLQDLRATLRPRMEASVLMNAPHFARQIETAYRAMWQQWCNQPIGQ